jgi:hypothetical protein
LLAVCVELSQQQVECGLCQRPSVLW